MTTRWPLRETRAIAQALGDRSNEAVILNNLGLTYDRAGRPDQAKGYYEQALAIHRELGDRAGEARALNNLGGLAETYGRYTDALKLYQQALDIFGRWAPPAKRARR